MSTIALAGKPETRADWYRRNNGASWRTARKNFQCDHIDKYGMRCQCVVLAGMQYLDTNAQNPRSKSPFIRMRFCGECANGAVA